MVSIVLSATLMAFASVILLLGCSIQVQGVILSTLGRKVLLASLSTTINRIILAVTVA